MTGNNYPDPTEAGWSEVEGLSRQAASSYKQTTYKPLQTTSNHLKTNKREKNNPSQPHIAKLSTIQTKSAIMADTTPATTPAPATSTSPPTETKRKMFVPLENNPQVMTTLLHHLGLSPTLSLHDVFSLSDPSLLAFVPRPASALLLVFPVSEVYEKYRREEDEGVQEYEGKGEGEEVTWFRQTIGNSCGLMALLHAAGNGSAREFVGESLLNSLSSNPAT